MWNLCPDPSFEFWLEIIDHHCKILFVKQLAVHDAPESNTYMKSPFIHACLCSEQKYKYTKVSTHMHEVITTYSKVFIMGASRALSWGSYYQGLQTFTINISLELV